MTFQTIHAGMRVFVRVDLNMPMALDVPLLDEAKTWLHFEALNDSPHTLFTDVTRLHAITETLTHLLNQGVKVLLVTHIGRPQKEAHARPSLWGEGAVYHPKLSTQHVLPLLRGVIDHHVPLYFAPHISCLSQIPDQGPSVILLENIRFWTEEERPTTMVTQMYADVCDAYVNEAFSVSHRKHMSVYDLPNVMKTQHKPCVAGITMLKEMEALRPLLRDATPPSKNYPLKIACLGGSKVSTKINLIQHLVTTCDVVFLGGGMANTFLRAQGLIPKGSFYEEDYIETARQLINTYSSHIMLPVDGVDEQTHSSVIFADNDPSQPLRIVDVGPQSLKIMQDYFSRAHTIVWNGPFGIVETQPFDQGSLRIADMLAQATSHAHTIVGGGDTLLCVQHHKPHAFSHVSTGGGAFLAYLEKGTLPGIESLSS